MFTGLRKKRVDRVLHILAGILAGLVTLAGVSALAGPQVEIINPTTNFGKVPQSKVVTTDFFIKSIGDETLKITTLWSGCGCAEIPLTDSTVDPGDSLQLRITFSTGRQLGLTVKRPTVRTNASEEVIKLSIAAEVSPTLQDAYPVGMTPDVADISQYGEKTRRMDKFNLQNKSAEDLRVVVVDSALKSFEVKVPDTVKAGETIEGRLRVIESMLDKDFQESVTFRLEGKETYYYTLPVVRWYRPLNPASE